MNTTSNKSYEQLKALVASMEADAEKFHNKGVAASGAKLRKALQEIRVLSGDYRKEIQEIKNAK